jgi:hypothetical protein
MPASLVSRLRSVQSSVDACNVQVVAASIADYEGDGDGDATTTPPRISVWSTRDRFCMRFQVRLGFFVFFWIIFCFVLRLPPFFFFSALTISIL